MRRGGRGHVGTRSAAGEITTGRRARCVAWPTGVYYCSIYRRVCLFQDKIRSLVELERFDGKIEILWLSPFSFFPDKPKWLIREQK